ILSSIMAYVDQKYAKPNNLPTVRQLGYDIFETSMFANSSIRRLLCQSVDEWTQYERKEKLPYPDRKRVEAMFAHLTAHNHFQAYQSYFISQTKEHYMAEAKEVADKSTSLEYFDHVIKRINEEIQIAKEVLGTSSLPDVQRTVESALLEGRMEWLAQQNIPAYIGSNSYEQLASMYNLFYRVNGVQTLCSAFGEFVKTKVEEIINDAARDDDMVQRLLEFKVSADTAIARSFIDVAAPTVGGPSDGQQVNHDFVYALTDGFTKGFKARRNKPAEMIARYVDKCMRQGQRGVSDAEFAMQMDRALALYRFTDDKDVFRRFYHRALAKRLLTDRSASTDAEKRMLKNLKDNYDPEFDAGEEMFKDLALSHDLLEDYRDRSDRGALGQKLSVMVLQNSVWPFSVQKEATIDLPPAMQAELNAFELFYKSKHANRTLHWDHSLGTVTLKARFERGAKDLSVSLYQAAILLLFNDQDGIPFEEIKAAVHHLADTELRRNLQSLACGKKHVLLKRPSGKQVDDKDIFVFNPEFWDERVQVHINSIQVKVSAEESTKTHMAVEEERKHVIDAAIVRVMKAKKELAYEKLKNAVIEGVKKHFMPDVEAIKKRIDVMVDQEYIERSENDRNVFKYVA
ncbi:Cullin-domain-containing protein, partial [Fistulina hepatica ATCC 64428]